MGNNIECAQIVLTCGTADVPLSVKQVCKHTSLCLQAGSPLPDVAGGTDGVFFA
jgi:hypothetical protein